MISWSSNEGAAKVTTSSDGKAWKFDYQCSSTSICSFYVVTIQPGTYLFELWGAQGGNSRHSSYRTYQGAVGGYSRGVISHNRETTLYFFIGGRGGLGDDFSGGFNGGGKGYASDFSNKGAGGGGATDIRKGGTDFSNRVIVAGGGGGSSTWQESNYGSIVSTGVGGGNEGGNGVRCLGGSQQSRQEPDSNCIIGTIGKGANAGVHGSGGGGGGFYGGNGGNMQGYNGGGGSGYIDRTVFKSFRGIHPITLPGTSSFPKPSLTNFINETGHIDNGNIIVRLVSTDFDYSRNRVKHLLHSFCFYILLFCESKQE